MKKFLLISLIIALVLIVIGGAGLVYAKVRGIGNVTSVTINATQNGDKIVQPFGYGPGGMLGRNGNPYGPGGMMGGDENGYGPGGMMNKRGFNSDGMLDGYDGGITCTGKMKDYIISAFASAVGLTTEEVNTQLSNGQTLKQIAIAQGKAEADLPALASQVYRDALNKAVADGVITQAQADQMLTRMNNKPGLGFGFGFGLGNCRMWNGGKSQQP